MYEAAPTYADLKCNGLTLLAVHFWLTVRVACGMLDQRKDLAAKGYQGLQSWPRQEEVTCHNTSILRILVGFSQFHPLRSMQKSHNRPLSQWGILSVTPQDPVSFSHSSSGASLKSGPKGHPQVSSPCSDTQHPRKDFRRFGDASSSSRGALDVV